MTMNMKMKSTLLCGAISAAGAFSPTTPGSAQCPESSSASSALFFFGGGSASKADLDDDWEKQQEMLRLRRAPPKEREKYFKEVEDRRLAADREQTDKWAWQSKRYKKGEDPIDEWRKRRASGQISNLDDQYGDEKAKGGIPFPMASFGVGGEFGVGGKFDNGGRFDLRLPYADQGYVDEDADTSNPFAGFFGGRKEIKAEEEKLKAEGTPVEKPKGFQWPF